MIFVCSWDDGHPLDRRLADMLTQRRLRGTFYVPLRNCEGRPVMGSADLRAIGDAGFEIGSHTADHRYLDGLHEQEALSQIVAGRDGLEQILGRGVTGFCYPGGRRAANMGKLLQQAGISYARTVENLRIDSHFDRFDVPTTLQFYPHRWQVLAKNTIAKPRALATKIWLALGVARAGDPFDGNLELLRSLAGSDAICHFWGHSWEIDRLDAWGSLASLLDLATDYCESSMTVAELTRHVGFI